MRETIKDRGRLEHMLAAIANVEEFTQGITLDDFVKSKVLFFAVVKNIEIVGEATYMLTKEFKQSHQSTPWLVIEKMRHVLYTAITRFRQKRFGILSRKTCLYLKNKLSHC